ncbi:MAG: hypothetical protein NC390_07865 [Fusobacterium sp.]|nr:hypothetical protein [Fusobacterium sp.]
MGCNGVYGLFGNGFTNPYLPMANFLTGTLGYKPCNIWPARNYTQFANVWTHNASYPYGFYFNFSGRPHYTVADAFRMPYQTAMGLQTGQTYGVPSIAALQMQFAQMNEASGIRIDSQLTASKLGKAKSIGACKDEPFMKAEENKELREEVLAMEKKADDLLKQLEDVMKQASEEKLSSSEAAAKIKVLSDAAKELVGETDELFKRITEAQEAYDKDAAEKAKAEQEEAADQAGSGSNGSSNVDGETTVTTTEGDKELKTNDALSKEYGVKEPIIASNQDVSEVTQKLKQHTDNNDDDKDYEAVLAMFTTGEINSDNIVEVMEEYGDYAKLYDGIYEMDNSKDIMIKFTAALTKRVEALNVKGFITPAEYNDYIKKIGKVKANLGGNTEDISSSEKKIAMTDGGTTKDLKIFSEYLKTYVIDKIKGKGTQADFDAKVTAKKTERETKARKDFYGAHAKTKTGKSVKNENAALPEGVTYLPNSKQFQWKCGDNVFKGETYTKLNDAILKCGKADVIANWNEVLKKLDENLK